MTRFAEGDLVLLHRTIGGECTPVMHGAVERLLGAQSVVFDYVARVGSLSFYVSDAWLAPENTTIFEVDCPAIRL